MYGVVLKTLYKTVVMNIINVHEHNIYCIFLFLDPLINTQVWAVLTTIKDLYTTLKDYKTTGYLIKIECVIQSRN